MKRKDKIKGGKADKMSVEDIAKKHDVSIEDIKAQIEMGKKIEMEHVNDEKLASEIAMDHLEEIPDYYTRLKKMEKEAKKELKNESITEYAKRMRQLCGLEIKEGFNTMQNPFDEDLSDVDVYSGPNHINPSAADMTQGIEEEEEKNVDSDYTVLKFEQKKIEKGKDDDSLYPLANQ
jgi:hypothetical protein